MAEFVFDQEGNVIKRVVEDRSERRPYDSWRQDSLITNAIEQVTDEKYEIAVSSLEQAYAVHPEHYYLANFLKYARLVLGPEYEKIKATIGKYVGQYGEREIVARDGGLYYKRDQAYNRLLPLSASLFQVFEQYSLQIEFIEEAGEIDLKMLYRHPEDKELYNW